jgi:hypothetical protein
MFISTPAIQKLRDECENPEIAKFIGVPVWFFTLIDGKGGVASVNAVITRIQPGDDPNGAFTVDLGIDTSVEGIYLVLTDLVVKSLVLENRKDGGPMERSALALEADLEEVSDIINAPRYGELSLVQKPE